MERQKKIVDASVMVKIFADEENSDKASNLLEEHINGKIILIAPEFIFLETLNALRYKKFNQKFLENSAQDLLEFQIEIVLLNKDLLNKAIQISAEYELSIYDAVYAALSQIQDTQLITEDEKLLKIPNAISLDKF